MQPKIGIMGSASGEHAKELLEKARQVGEAIAEKGCILLYGATIGLSLAAAKGAKKKGAMVIGISPAANEKEHLEKYNYPVEPSDAVVFTGFGFPGRNVVLVRSCNAVIIVGGRIGTMNEFAAAYAEGRLIGILVGSGGFADRVMEYEQEVLQGKEATQIVYDANPKKLVEKVLQALKPGKN